MYIGKHMQKQWVMATFLSVHVHTIIIIRRVPLYWWKCQLCVHMSYPESLYIPQGTPVNNNYYGHLLWYKLAVPSVSECV